MFKKYGRYINFKPDSILKYNQRRKKYTRPGFVLLNRKKKQSKLEQKPDQWESPSKKCELTWMLKPGLNGHIWLFCEFQLLFSVRFLSSLCLLTDWQ